MPFYRGTWLFNFPGTPPCGFSESWDFDAATDQLAIQQMQPFFKERAALMSQDWTIIGARLSSLAPVLRGTPTACHIDQTPVDMQICLKAQPGLINSDADTPWAALLVDIGTRQSAPPLSVPPRPRRWQLRGIPDDWWQGVLNVPPAQLAAINDFVKYLRTQLQAGHVKANSGCNALAMQPYTAGCVKRISNRQIGRPFGLLVGRRSIPDQD